MGFNKYIQLGNATNILTQEYIAQSIEIEEERTQYKNLLEEHKKYQDLIDATKVLKKVNQKEKAGMLKAILGV